MPDITLPEVKLPDIKLPDGLRDMTRDDIVQAAKDVHMPKMEMPKKIEIPDIDLSKVELPKQIADRLPNRRRSNPILPIAGVVAIGALIAGAWWLITSPLTGPRVRHAFYDIRSRLTGQPTDVVRYDDEQDLGSLLGTETSTARSYTATPGEESTRIPVGPGEARENVTATTY